MKKYLPVFTILFVSLALSCNMTNGDPPDNINKAFTETFPGASEVEWEFEDDIWEAEFTWEDKEYEVSYKLDGTWHERKHSISEEDLPPTAKQILLVDFDGKEILELEFVERIDFRGYEVEIDNEGKEMELFFNEGGELVAIDLVEGDDEERDD